jgi:GNAT superfamily N-acetyltransferase
MSAGELKIHLRQVVLPDDEAFLRRLYASRREDLNALPLESAQLETLINIQYDAQDRGYRAEFPTAEHFVVEVDGLAAGRYLIDRSRTNEDWVIDIAVMHEYRGRGIASKVLTDSIAEARRAGKGLTLQVDPRNPALRLYLRLGGEVVHGDQTYLTLKWPVNEFVPGDPNA